MLLGIPLALAEQLQPRAVQNQVDRPAARPHARLAANEDPAAPAHGRMIRHWQLDPPPPRAGLRVGTSRTEGTATFPINRRLAKSQQMRGSRRGADLLLQVRSAVHNGALGSGFGQLLEPTPGSGLHWAETA